MPHIVHPFTNERKLDEIIFQKKTIKHASGIMFCNLHIFDL